MNSQDPTPMPIVTDTHNRVRVTSFSLRHRLVAASMLVPLAGVTIVIGAALAQSQPVAAPAGKAAPAAQPVAVQPVAAQPVVGQPAAAPFAAPANSAIAVLLERANFWRNQAQFDQALASLDRAQKLDPRNADVLALTGQIQAESGNRAEAERSLAKLRQVAPGDTRIERIDQAIKIGPISNDSLADARRLARDGKIAEAVDRYNRVLRGNPPPDNLAVEYYQTLAGTEGGWEKARDGLAATVRANPQDVRAQLAYAQMLTYRDAARAEGISRLSTLSQNAAVADQATRAWRQALGWLPQEKGSIEPLQAYLATHPNDADVQQRLELAKNPPPDPNDPSAPQRIAAFELLNKGKINDAATSFQQAIAANANDADAIGGLGVVRLRQGKYDEARTLLTRAMSMDPANKGRWEPALKGVAAAVAGSQPDPVNVMVDRGDFAGAEAELTRQTRSGGSAATFARLADMQARQGKTSAAEQSYRNALAKNPNFASALVGLAGIVGGRGGHDEAIGLLRRAEQVGGDRRLVGQARALQLREQAMTITDPATQAGLIRSAIDADPGNPWLRLDFARSLVKQGDLPGARAVMAQVVAGNPGPEALKAGILFANETSDPDAATTLYGRLPPNARSADLRSLQAQAELQREIGRLMDLPRATARQRLLAMANVADPDGARGAAISRALASIGDPASARRAILVAREATPNQQPGARVAYAGALLDVGDATGAQVMLTPLGNGSVLTAEQRKSFLQLRAGLAVKTADSLNQAGRQAEAYDRLAPVMAADPDNTDMNLALARLYSGARNPREALDINEALLRRDPQNSDARRGAVAAAIQTGDKARAEALVREGLEIAPDDPKSWMASADLAKSRGNTARALRDLAHARQLRLQQLGYADNGTDDSTLTHVTLDPNDAPVTVQSRAQIRTAPLGTNQPLSPALLTYGSPDRGQDVPALAVPPSFGRPTPLALPSQDSATPVQVQAQPQPKPVAQPAQQVQPVPVQYAPAQPRYQAPAQPRYQVPVASALPDPTPLPPFAPAAEPVRGRVLDTQASVLPQPLRLAQNLASQNLAGQNTRTPADELNAQQLQSVSQPSYPSAPSYPAAPSYPQATYPQATYPAAVPQQIRPQYAQPNGTVGYQQPYAGAPVPAGYAPVAQVPVEMRYQPQAQGYLPQYAPAPAQTAAQRIASDDAQFLRDTDFNKSFRPFLPRSAGVDAEGPYGNSGQPNGPVGFYDNPFRRAPDDALAAAPTFRVASGNGFATSSVGAQTAGPDPVEQEIDRSIVQLRDGLSPTAQGGFGFRMRSGDAGLDKLTEITVPMSTSFSPLGNGVVTLTATPVSLDAGVLGGDDSNLQRFGTYALGLKPPQTGTTYVPPYYPGSPGNRPGTQTAQGVGMNIGYTNQILNAGFGSSPVGFKVPNMVGGVEITPAITPNVRLKVGIERTSVTDSVLSYAGTRDPVSGRTWGGVVRNRGKLEVDITSGNANFYIGGAGGNVTGRHVETNTEMDFGMGGSAPIYKQGDDEIRAGVDLTYISYTKNLRFFTLGQGGYFSPQSYVSALIPFTYRTKVDDDLTYEFGVAIGAQTFSEKSSPLYPSDPALQTQLDNGASWSGLNKRYPARSQSGFAGNMHGKLDYRVSPGLSIGAQLAYQHSGSFDEAAGTVFARYVFNGTHK